MITAKLSEFADAIGATLHGQDVTVKGMSIDSRADQKGGLFVVIRGERFDAHDFVEQAVSNGAAAVVVERKLDVDAPQLVVRDSRKALGKLASWWRQQWRSLGEQPKLLVAITGSNGKTTTKQLLAAVLAGLGPVHATAGNLNNDIGVPLTLLALAPEHQVAVIEMGANHPGEIAYLASMAKPDIGMVLNVGPAHLEGFGTIEGVARAKGEMFAALGKDNKAIVNADAGWADIWNSQIADTPVLRFGMQAAADVTAHDLQFGLAGSEFELSLPSEKVVVHLPLPGEHNVMNALAVATAAHAAGLSGEKIAAGFARVEPPPGRLQPKVGPYGSHLLDDTYNANPESLRAGVEHLLQCPGAHWLVLGDMAELGDNSIGEHREVGHMAKQAGVQRLYTYGSLAAQAVKGFGSNAESYDSHEELVAALTAQIGEQECADVSILIKGSRAAAMDRVVAMLSKRQEG